MMGDTKRETLSYLIVGGCTTALGWVIFTLALHFHGGTIFANNLANGISILFAFFANKIFVFRSASWEKKQALPELLKFLSARLLTHVLETAALFLLVEVWELPGFIMKGLTLFFIQVLGNYALSKWVVFVKK